MMRHYSRPAPTSARLLHRSSADARNRLWRALGEAFPQAGFRRQVPYGSYVVDFASFPEKLIIEVEGGQNGEASGWDADRTRFLARQGYWVMRVLNSEILEDLDGVLAAIAENLSVASLSLAALRGAAFPLPAGDGLMEN